MAGRVLFVCTPSLKASAHAARVRSSLGALLVAEFTEVAPHVPREAVETARVLAIENQVDLVVALGGGSAIGVGKGMALENPHPALIAIPTTYAGSEMTPVVGITDRGLGRKQVQRDPALLPKLAIYDPELTLDLPRNLTASTAMNALAHCVEACYTRDANPVVGPVALEGIRRIVRSLPKCVADGNDIDAREEVLLGAYLAGFSIANATMALHHGLCHVLGARTGIPHGVANAVVMPHVMRFNAAAVPQAMIAIADAMGVPSAGDPLAAAAAVASLRAALPVPQRLRNAGVPEQLLPALATEAFASSTVKANPRPATEADLIALLQAAW